MELKTAKYHTNRKKIYLQKRVYCSEDHDGESSHSDVVDFDSMRKCEIVLVEKNLSNKVSQGTNLSRLVPVKSLLISSMVILTYQSNLDL